MSLTFTRSLAFGKTALVIAETIVALDGDTRPSAIAEAIKPTNRELFEAMEHLTTIGLLQLHDDVRDRFKVAEGKDLILVRAGKKPCGKVPRVPHVHFPDITSDLEERSLATLTELGLGRSLPLN